MTQNGAQTNKEMKTRIGKENGVGVKQEEATHI